MTIPLTSTTLDQKRKRYQPKRLCLFCLAEFNQSLISLSWWAPESTQHRNSVTDPQRVTGQHTTECMLVFDWFPAEICLAGKFTEHPFVSVRSNCCIRAEKGVTCKLVSTEKTAIAGFQTCFQKQNICLLSDYGKTAERWLLLLLQQGENKDYPFQPLIPKER